MDHCLAHLLFNDNLAVAVSRFHAMNVVQTPDVYCFGRTGNSDNIYNYHVSMLIRKDHQLYGKINDIVSRSFEAGLFNKWTRDSRYQLQPNRMEQQPYKVQLGMEHISGAIIAYITIGAMAVIALITEIVVNKQMMKRNPARFWRLMHKLIDSKRYGFMELYNDVSYSDSRPGLREMRDVVRSNVCHRYVCKRDK